MNDSQISLSASDSGLSESGTESNVDDSFHRSHSQTDLSRKISQRQANGVTPFSSLVCDVHRLAGEEPPGLVGAATAILGDKLYVFGGRLRSTMNAKLTSDLYELDLIRRKWTLILPDGDIPPPRYFHSICALGETKLVCYGGMSPISSIRPSAGNRKDDQACEVVIMSDIHLYDCVLNTWTRLPSTVPTEQAGRYAHCATILPSSATFTSATAHKSAIHYNPSNESPNSGAIGVSLDGSGGAEMIIVGGQDGGNNYLEEILVYNFRSLKWTQNAKYDRKSGAYKSMVTTLPDINASRLGTEQDLYENATEQNGTSVLIYSNYNFTAVHLELQVRMPDGSVVEKPMSGNVSPPGLRFPNGGVINGYFVVSGTYLTSNKHEYALWALNLRDMAWTIIDTSGTPLSKGSWNRGMLWSKRNAYVVLGHRKRNLVDDYNQRRVNFTNLCIVELEAFGLYENPVPRSPIIKVGSKMYGSNSGTYIGENRYLSPIAQQLGHTALHLPELNDMEIIAHGGEHIPCNSFILSRRWGSYFDKLNLEGANASHLVGPMSSGGSENTLPSRMSSLTIAPGPDGVLPGLPGSSDTTVNARKPLVAAAARSRVLYLPHTAATIKLMLQFLYTSSLPASTYGLCDVHTLCSLLQLARPYQINGLQEATIQRLHEVLDGRNAAAVFNAAALAAGSGKATDSSLAKLTEEANGRRESGDTIELSDDRRATLTANNVGRLMQSHNSMADEHESDTDTDVSASGSTTGSHDQHDFHTRIQRVPWAGGISSVIGLQKRGLRGLVESRRLREIADNHDRE